MSRISASKNIEKNFPEMACHAAAIVSSMPGNGHVFLAESGDDITARRRDDRVVTLAHTDMPSFKKRGARDVQLSFPANEKESARAALIAATVSRGDPVAADSNSIAMLNLAERVAMSNVPVLVTGPTGTGKEVLSRFIHNASPRKDKPFIAINCAAMPETMLEAMLFGHRKGAFTGATEANEGFFRAADGGTLLLDELGEMPTSLQAKLLRVLEQREVVPLGSTSAIPVDVRIIACTNCDLQQQIMDGNFREDLYFRLNVFPLRLDALRERRNDIAPLAFTMLLRHAMDGADIPWISSDALIKLEHHNWPGNVRELENVLRRALLLMDNTQYIEAEHIVFDHAARVVNDDESRVSNDQPVPDTSAGEDLATITRKSESRAILRCLQSHDGNRRATARDLGISERTLRYRLASMRDDGLLAAGEAL